MDIETEIDQEVAEMLAACQKAGPSEIIPDGEFEPTEDLRF